MEIDGLEIDGQGRLPRPTLTVSNIEGRLGALVRQYKDLNGCIMTMRTTLSDYIDACNFKGAHPCAAPGVEMPKEIYIFERKAEETIEYVKFELSSALDLEGQMLPKRCFYTNYCTHEFGGPLCNASGGGCDHTLIACEARHGKGNALPFGGFPGAAAVGR
jgi:lambda family phage minor tail protein L